MGGGGGGSSVPPAPGEQRDRRGDVAAAIPRGPRADCHRTAGGGTAPGGQRRSFCSSLSTRFLLYSASLAASRLPSVPRRRAVSV